MIETRIQEKKTFLIRLFSTAFIRDSEYFNIAHLKSSEIEDCHNFFYYWIFCYLKYFYVVILHDNFSFILKRFYHVNLTGVCPPTNNLEIHIRNLLAGVTLLCSYTVEHGNYFPVFSGL